MSFKIGDYVCVDGDWEARVASITDSSTYVVERAKSLEHLAVKADRLEASREFAYHLEDCSGCVKCDPGIGFGDFRD